MKQREQTKGQPKSSAKWINIPLLILFLLCSLFLIGLFVFVYLIANVSYGDEGKYWTPLTLYDFFTVPLFMLMGGLIAFALLINIAFTVGIIIAYCRKKNVGKPISSILLFTMAISSSLLIIAAYFINYTYASSLVDNPAWMPQDDEDFLSKAIYYIMVLRQFQNDWFLLPMYLGILFGIIVLLIFAGMILDILLGRRYHKALLTNKDEEIGEDKDIEESIPEPEIGDEPEQVPEQSIPLLQPDLSSQTEPTPSESLQSSEPKSDKVPLGESPQVSAPQQETAPLIPQVPSQQQVAPVLQPQVITPAAQQFPQQAPVPIINNVTIPASNNVVPPSYQVPCQQQVAPAPVQQPPKEQPIQENKTITLHFTTDSGVNIATKSNKHNKYNDNFNIDKLSGFPNIKIKTTLEESNLTSDDNNACELTLKTNALLNKILNEPKNILTEAKILIEEIGQTINRKRIETLLIMLYKSCIVNNYIPEEFKSAIFESVLNKLQTESEKSQFDNSVKRSVDNLWTYNKEAFKKLMLTWIDMIKEAQ